MIIRVPDADPDSAAKAEAVFCTLTQQGPDAAMRWLDNVESGATWAPAFAYSNLWLMFADIADRESRGYAIPRWIHVKIRVLEALHRYWETQGSPYFGHLSSAMACRVSLICLYGHQSGDPYQDIQIVLSWARGHLMGPINEVLAMTDEWWIDPDPNDIDRLRRVRTALYWLHRLVECGQIEPDEALQEWLNIRSKLP